MNETKSQIFIQSGWVHINKTLDCAGRFGVFIQTYAGTRDRSSVVIEKTPFAHWCVF